MKNIVLDNGLKVLFHQMLNTHSVTIGLYIKAGSGYEDEELNGITHFLEHLHFRRLGEINQEELYYRLESMGTNLRGVTYHDFLEFSMKITPDRLRGSLDIFKSIIDADDWTDEEFLKEKRVVINQIREKGDFIFIEDEMRKVVFHHSPLSQKITGTIENVQRFQKRDLQKYKRRILNNRNVMFCITGNISDDNWQTIRDELETINLQKDENHRELTMPAVFHCRKPDIVFLTTEDNYLDVNLSFDVSVTEENGKLLPILNCILGEGTGSRLQKSVRENRGYTSDIYSYIERYQGFAVLHIRFSAARKIVTKCLAEIFQIIKSLKSEITQKDLDVSLPFYTGNRIFLEDDTAEMNFQLAYEKFILDNQYKGYEGLDLRDRRSLIVQLQELAEIVFVPNNVSAVILGNTNKISKKSIKDIIEQLS